MSGLSKPRRCSIWWTYAGGTWPPSAAWIGFPGATRRSRKTSVRRINTIGTTSARRVMRDVLREVPVTYVRFCRKGRLGKRRPCRGRGVELLRDEPEAHVVRRVQRRIDALHAALADRDHVPLPVRNRRQRLCPEELHLLEIRVPRGSRLGTPLLRDELVHRLAVVAVVVERLRLVEGDRVVVGVRIVREPAELERPVDLPERTAVLRPLGGLQGHFEQTRRVERPLDLRVLLGRRVAIVRRRPPERDLQRSLHAGGLHRGLRLREVRLRAVHRLLAAGLARQAFRPIG